MFLLIILLLSNFNTIRVSPLGDVNRTCNVSMESVNFGLHLYGTPKGSILNK